VAAASSQLIAREAGASVTFGELPLAAAALDLDVRFPIAAASSEAGLATVLAAQGPAAPRPE
jgi:hypothetical protein